MSDAGRNSQKQLSGPVEKKLKEKTSSKGLVPYRLFNLLQSRHSM